MLPIPKPIAVVPGLKGACWVTQGLGTTCGLRVRMWNWTGSSNTSESFILSGAKPGLLLHAGPQPTQGHIAAGQSFKVSRINSLWKDLLFRHTPFLGDGHRQVLGGLSLWLLLFFFLFPTKTKREICFQLPW